MSEHEVPEQEQAVPPRPGARLARNMVFYTILRLLLVVLIVAAILGIGALVGVTVPLLVAAIIAIVIALPLSMALFGRMRAEINSDIAAVDANRRNKRDDLRRRMNG